jgi:hypothetical protein
VPDVARTSDATSPIVAIRAAPRRETLVNIPLLGQRPGPRSAVPIRGKHLAW